MMLLRIEFSVDGISWQPLATRDGERATMLEGPSNATLKVEKGLHTPSALRKEYKFPSNDTANIAPIEAQFVRISNAQPGFAGVSIQAEFFGPRSLALYPLLRVVASIRTPNV